MFRVYVQLYYCLQIHSLIDHWSIVSIESKQRLKVLIRWRYNSCRKQQRARNAWFSWIKNLKLMHLIPQVQQKKSKRVKENRNREKLIEFFSSSSIRINLVADKFWRFFLILESKRLIYSFKRISSWFVYNTQFHYLLCILLIFITRCRYGLTCVCTVHTSTLCIALKSFFLPFVWSFLVLNTGLVIWTSVYHSVICSGFFQQILKWQVPFKS